LKTKTAEEVVKAMKNIIKTNKRKPKKIWCDCGSEFVNKIFKKFMDDNCIEMYHTYSENKSCMVERLNRTIKTLLTEKIFLNKIWIVELYKVINFYKNKIHSSIKMSPKNGSLK
jgi:hypothetical protein